MADLEEMGFVASPHTSAGRIPTHRGYRFFIDTLLVVKPLDIMEIHHVAGEDCFILKVRAADPRGLEALLKRLRTRLHVDRTVTMIVLSTVKDDARFHWHEEA